MKTKTSKRIDAIAQHTRDTDRKLFALLLIHDERLKRIEQMLDKLGACFEEDDNDDT